MDITFGVPKDSILGPTLFRFYVNEFFVCVLWASLSLCFLSQYANDTSCVVANSAVHLVSSRVNTILFNMCAWEGGNGLLLNVVKTNVLQFWASSNVSINCCLKHGDRLVFIHENSFYRIVGLHIDFLFEATSTLVNKNSCF